MSGKDDDRIQWIDYKETCEYWTRENIIHKNEESKYSNTIKHYRTN